MSPFFWSEILGLFAETLIAADKYFSSNKQIFTQSSPRQLSKK